MKIYLRNHLRGWFIFKTSSTPIEPNHNLAKASNLFFAMPARYCWLIGKSIYLTTTRKELAYTVRVLAQFMQTSRNANWDAALFVVRYLKGCLGPGILADSPLVLATYCDSDWASCLLTRCYVTGYFISFGCSPISRKTKKQQTVSQSSAEAEYRSKAVTLCELKWLYQLLCDLRVSMHWPIILTINILSTLLQIRFFTSAQNTLKLTSISFVTSLKRVLSLPAIFVVSYKLQVFSQRCFIALNFIFGLASWLLRIFKLQLEKEY